MALGWSGPSPILLRYVCVCVQPALMIVCNLTRAIVICVELHGKAYRFIAGEQEKQQWLGGQMLGERKR